MNQRTPAAHQADDHGGGQQHERHLPAAQRGVAGQPLLAQGGEPLPHVGVPLRAGGAERDAASLHLEARQEPRVICGRLGGGKRQEPVQACGRQAGRTWDRFLGKGLLGLADRRHPARGRDGVRLEHALRVPDRHSPIFVVAGLGVPEAIHLGVEGPVRHVAMVDSLDADTSAGASRHEGFAVDRFSDSRPGRGRRRRCRAGPGAAAGRRGRPRGRSRTGRSAELARPTGHHAVTSSGGAQVEDRHLAVWRECHGEPQPRGRSDDVVPTRGRRRAPADRGARAERWRRLLRGASRTAPVRPGRSRRAGTRSRRATACRRGRCARAPRRAP